jgi:periplasmic protein TonB
LGPSRNCLFEWTLAVSLLAHGAAFLLLSRVDFQLPMEVPPQLGKASVRLLPSHEVRSESSKRPIKEMPRPVVVPQEVDPIEVLVTEVPEPLAPERAVPVPAPPEPAMPVPQPTKKVAKISSVSSPASEASEGAVDELPQEAVNPAPPYPPEARAAGQEGRVWLRVKVDATGKVTAVSVYESSGYELLDDSAVRTVRRWVFYPAKRNGKPVPYEYLKPVRFTIRRM